MYIYISPPMGSDCTDFYSSSNCHTNVSVPLASAVPLPRLSRRGGCTDPCTGQPARWSSLAGGVCACVWRGCAWVCEEASGSTDAPGSGSGRAQDHSCFCAVLDKSTGLRHWHLLPQGRRILPLWDHRHPSFAVRLQIFVFNSSTGFFVHDYGQLVPLLSNCGVTQESAVEDEPRMSLST